MSYLKHEVKIHKDQYWDATHWCFDQFGSRWSPVSNSSGAWAVFWCGTDQRNLYRFSFAQEQDMVWFALRFA